MSNADKLGMPAFGWLLNHDWFVVLLLAWLITPIGLYIVALLLEKRLAPIWPNQFLTFLLGDPALGGFLAASVVLTTGMAEESHRWYQQWWWTVACVAFGLVVFVIGHFVLDGDNYDRRQLMSPSKLYHDFILFIGYGALLLRVGLPALLHGGGVVPRVIAVSLLCVFGLTMFLDAKTSRQIRERLYSHVHPFRGLYPCWRRGPFINDNK